MLKKISKVFIIFLTIILLSNVGIASNDLKGLPVFNQRVMDELKVQGYKWDDLVEASKLTYKYGIALETILQLRPTDVDWKRVEQALQHLKQVKNDFAEKKVTDPALLSLVNENLTEDQIAILVYYAALQGESVAQVAEKVKKAKKEDRPLEGAKDFLQVELKSVEPEYAAESTSTVTDWEWGAGYDADKTTPFAAIVSNQNETINPLTGNLMVTATDLSLPGRNGLDFILTRVYRSEKAELQTFGRDEDEDGNGIEVKEMGNYLASLYHLGHGWGFDLPSVQLIPGTFNPLFLHLGVGNTYAVDLQSETGLSGMTTSDYKFTKDYSTVTYMLKHKSGTTYYFDKNGRITKMTNSYGDMIQYIWNELTGEYLNEVSWLEKVIDSVGREVIFDYNLPLGYITVTVNAIGMTTPYQIKYKMQTVTTPLDEGWNSYVVNVLKEVEYPENQKINYSYSCDIATFGDAIGYFMNLTTVTNPYGGTSTYVYNSTPVDSNYDWIPDHFTVDTRYSLIDQKYENYTKFTYGGTYEEKVTTVEYYGDNISSFYGSPYAKKEIYTYDNDTSLNTKIETEVPAEGGSNREVKVFTYYNRLPEYITTTNSKDGTTTTSVFKQNIDYNEKGSLIRSADITGRVEESSYSMIQLPNGVEKEVLNWTRKQMNYIGTGKMEFVEQKYAHDDYGNISMVEEKELNGTYNSVTENMLSNHKLSEKNRVWFLHLPKGSSKIQMSYDWYASAASDVDVEIRFWVEGTTRPTTITSTNGWKIEHDGGWFVSKTGSNTTPELLLNSNSKYIVEVSCPYSGYFTITSFYLTYDKLTFAETLKATTYNHYSTPATFGSPDVVHKEYGTKNHSTAWGSDGCISTKYEYRACIDEDPLTLSPDPTVYSLFPTKISQNYLSAEGASKWEVSELLYNHFGQITYAKKGDTTKKNFYDLAYRLKKESVTSNRTLETNYDYSVYPDVRGYYYTTISHQDASGGGAEQHITRYYYNSLGHPVETQKGPLTAPLTVEKIEYDGFGRRMSVEDGIGVKTIFDYDGTGRVTKSGIKDENGNETTYKKTMYDDGSRTITEEVFEKKENLEVDQLVAKTVQYLYLSGNIQYIDQYPDVTNPSLTYRTQYTYNLGDQVTSVINPNNIRTGYSYDYFGVSKVDYPTATSLTGVRKDDEYIYEYVGRTQHVLKKVGDNSYSTTYYDDLGRFKKIEYPDGRTVRYYYDSTGRLEKTSINSTVTIEYQYDVTGNVSQAIHTYPGQISPCTFNYAYDEKGNLISITYPNGYQVSYNYDLYGRVKTIPNFVVGSGVTYLDNGFMEKVNYAATSLFVTTTYTPDSLGRIQSIQNNYMNYTYSYDAVGNIMEVTGWDQYTGTTNYSYDYNDLGWLTNATHGGNTYVYNYDKAGNRTSQVVNGTTVNYVYDPVQLNILKQVQIGTSYYDVFHDDWGNMTDRRDKNLTFTYDNTNQLTSVNKKGRVIQNNYYNSEGKRYKKVENSKETYYYYSGETLLYEETSDGTKVNYIYLNGKQIAKVETKNGVQKKYFYFTDHLGSTRAMIDPSGKLIGTVYYEPFGDEKPYYPGRDSSYPNQTGLESTDDITGRLSGTLELTTDRVEGDYALLAKIGDDPYNFTNLVLATEYNGTMDTEEARYYHIWAKPEAGAEWIYFAFPDESDMTKDYEYLCPDDQEMRYRIGKELEPNAWNLILLDMREGTGDGVDQYTSFPIMFTDEYSQWKWDYFGVSVKDPVTFTGKQQDDTTGLYYFNARYYDPDLGRFITEDPVRDGANWYVYCENNPLKYVDPSGKSAETSYFFQYKYIATDTSFITRGLKMERAAQFEFIDYRYNQMLLAAFNESGLAIEGVLLGLVTNPALGATVAIGGTVMLTMEAIDIIKLSHIAEYINGVETFTLIESGYTFETFEHMGTTITGEKAWIKIKEESTKKYEIIVGPRSFSIDEKTYKFLLSVSTTNNYN